MQFHWNERWRACSFQVQFHVIFPDRKFCFFGLKTSLSVLLILLYSPSRPHWILNKKKIVGLKRISRNFLKFCKVKFDSRVKIKFQIIYIIIAFTIKNWLRDFDFKFGAFWEFCVRWNTRPFGDVTWRSLPGSNCRASRIWVVDLQK